MRARGLRSQGARPGPESGLVESLAPSSVHLATSSTAADRRATATAESSEPVPSPSLASRVSLHGVYGGEDAEFAAGGFQAIDEVKVESEHLEHVGAIGGEGEHESVGEFGPLGG